MEFLLSGLNVALQIDTIYNVQIIFFIRVFQTTGMTQRSILRYLLLKYI